MTNERAMLTEIVDDLMEKMDLPSTYSIKPNRKKTWLIEFEEFGGNLGQQMIFTSILAIKLSKPNSSIHPHRVSIKWSDEDGI
jgi:hypothetical protein